MATSRSQALAELDFEFDRVPGEAELIEVSTDVQWLRMPLPFSLAHINLWLIRDGDGWAAVDTGIKTPDTKALWNDILANKLGGASLSRVIVTHLHPDHVGMAGWLTYKLGITLWMSQTDYLLCRVLAADTGRAAPEAGINHYRAAGFDDAAIERYKNTFGMFGMGVSPLPDTYRRIEDNECIVIGDCEWRVLVGRGHAPEHACLFNERDNLIIAGDQILPTISSNVSVWPTEPEANPLQLWLDSCRHLQSVLPENVLVLPAHGKPFRGARVRLQQLIDEHEAGLAKLRELCRTPKRSVDAFPALFRSKITDSNLMMATGEAIAHLNYLLHRNEIVRERDDSGVYWYHAPA